MENKVSAGVSMREKWFQFLKGEDVGPMVSPLCDDWCLDQPYHWPYEQSDPFPPGTDFHSVSQQLAMAGVCGWDPTFLAGVSFPPSNSDILPETKSYAQGNRTRHEHRIRTPHGDLTSVTETATSIHTVKAWLENADDYGKAIWLTRQQMDYDENVAVEEGRCLREGIADRGILGTWCGPPIVNLCNREMMFYHMVDWPDLFAELHEATSELELKKIVTLRKAGFDYLFYCVDGTEWISPEIFRAYIMENTRRIFERWKAEGGFILWHSCGHAKTFLEEGFYNELKPDMFETLSVPPVGNLPSLRWAREKLDPAIATKGNIDLGILLSGSEQDVRDAVYKVREATAGFRHIVGLSDDIFHNTPLANCRAMVEASREP